MQTSTKYKLGFSVATVAAGLTIALIANVGSTVGVASAKPPTAAPSATAKPQATTASATVKPPATAVPAKPSAPTTSAAPQATVTVTAGVTVDSEAASDRDSEDPRNLNLEAGLMAGPGPARSTWGPGSLTRRRSRRRHSLRSGPAGRGGRPRLLTRA